MAFLIGNQAVIDNSRNLTNIATFDSTVASTWDQVTTTAVDKNLVNREYCTVTASGRFLALPATPSPGWEVLISVRFFTNTVVTRNFSNIMGVAENITLDVAYATVRFTYVDSTLGWVIS
jgi:hypothetical protein